MKNILAISGSLRSKSTNLSIIKTVAGNSAEYFKFNLYSGLAMLPQFNPDLDNEDLPAGVKDLRKQIREADGVLICTPEYVFGVPGALKNALDWTVSSTDFSDKPVALITASLSGEKAHESLLLTLNTLGAIVCEDAALLISFVRTKVNMDGEITDAATLKSLSLLIKSFRQTIIT